MIKLGKMAYALAAFAALASISAQTSNAAPPTQDVNIANTPLPTRDVDNPARQPIQVFASQSIVSSVASAVVFTVPPGKRLVVEHFSSEVGVPTGTVVNAYGLAVTDPAQPGFASFEHFVPPAFHSPCANCVAGSDLWVTSQPIRLYVDAGKTLRIAVSVNGATGNSAFVFFSASGYLVDAQ